MGYITMQSVILLNKLIFICKLKRVNRFLKIKRHENITNNTLLFGDVCHPCTNQSCTAEKNYANLSPV
jgi:hypothetical protein